jgi:hypothetical protein
MAKKVTQPSSRAARVGTSVASGSTGGDDHRVNAVGAAHTPTPLDPWELEGLPTKAPCGCECTQSPAPSQTPRPTPTEARPKGDDCCKQIIEILRCLPGIDEKCLHIRKPKTPPKVKMANLHGVLPIKERIVPTLNLVLRRLRKGVPAGNVFEQKLQTFLTALPTKQRAALDAALDGYDALPAANREGVFETRFDNWSDGDALDPNFIARNVVGEFIALGRYNRFGPEPPPFPSPTRPRSWKQTFPLPGEPGKFAKIRAPWPWICAISPTGHNAIDQTGWFRNESSCVPGNVPRLTTDYLAHEVSWTCAAPSPGAPLHCTAVEPSGVGANGSYGFATCPGGEDYRGYDRFVGKQVCLTVPEVDPGAEVGLRGLNFLNPNAQVDIRKVDDPPFRMIPPQPLTDWQPDTKTAQGIVTCEVEDFAYFNMPSEVKEGPNKYLLPPGRYAIRLIVPNEVGYATAVGQPPPANFASNEILIDLQPRPDQKFQILIDQAGCEEETDGPGSDEPWFRAIVGWMELPKAETDIQFPVFNRVEILTAENVDSGDLSIPMKPASLFHDSLGRKLIGIGILGLEVDSEKAAREQIDTFFEAFTDYFSEFLVQLGLSVSLGGSTIAAIAEALSKSAVASIGVWVGGAVAAAIIAGAFFYAAWAPADLLALDNMTYTSRQLFDMTAPNDALVPEPSWYRMHQLRMSSEALLPKVPQVGLWSLYSEKRTYINTWENSRYRLIYRFKRT